MGLNTRDIKDAKDELVKVSTRGFGYYLKNIALIILIVLGVYMLTHPELLINPSDFFKDISASSLWSVLIVFIIIGGIYQLSKNLFVENREKEVKDAYNKFKEDDIKQYEETHRELVTKRFEATSAISNILKELIIKLGADRVTLCEMHNGTNNLAGIPFVFLSMTSEEISPEYTYISDEFKDFNLAKFPFIANHFKDGSWIGTIEEIEREDPYFAGKLKLTEASTLALMIIRGKSTPIGVLTVAFNTGNNEIPTKAKIIGEMAQEAQVISTLLDIDK